MRKILCLLIVMVLCLCLVGTALAEDITTDTIVINWEDMEGYIESNGLKGEFYVLEDIGLLFWVPDTLEPAELPEDGNTYLGFFLNEDSSFGMGITVTDPVDGLDFEKYYAVLEQMAETTGYVKDLEVAVVNDLAVIAFTAVDEEGEDTANVMCIVLDDGSVLAFTIVAPQNDEQDMLTALMAASVQPVE